MKLKSLFLASLLMSSLISPVWAQGFGNGSNTVKALLPNNDGSSSGDCDPAVYQMQSNLVKKLVDDRTAYAYGNYSRLPPGQGYGTLSCIDNLFNGSLDIIFNPPSLSGLIQRVLSAACNKLDNQIAQITSMDGIQSSLGGSLPIGELIPGVNLGSLSGGVQVVRGNGPGVLQSLMGNSNQSFVNTNLASVWRNQQAQYDYSINNARNFLNSASNLGSSAVNNLRDIVSPQSSGQSMCSAYPGTPYCN